MYHLGIYVLVLQVRLDHGLFMTKKRDGAVVLLVYFLPVGVPWMGKPAGYYSGSYLFRDFGWARWGVGNSMLAYTILDGMEDNRVVYVLSRRGA